jgi:hypothetical protein
MTNDKPITSEAVYGIRGGIARDQMERIRSELPVSYELGMQFPFLADPLSTLPRLSITKVRAKIRLSQGWHMLNEARMALVEAEACKFYYGEREPNATEASYWCRFYLDDAMLRLYSSCEHLLRALMYHYSLKLPISDPNGSRKQSLLVAVIKAAEQSEEPVVSAQVAKILRKVRSNASWSSCKDYRDKWVHSERPSIEGLDFAVSFGKISDRDAAILKQLGVPVGPQFKRVSVGVGDKIEALRENVRNGYVVLQATYQSIANLVA